MTTVANFSSFTGFSKNANSCLISLHGNIIVDRGQVQAENLQTAESGVEPVISKDEIFQMLGDGRAH
jgi:hypothetical protein